MRAWSLSGVSGCGGAPAGERRWPVLVALRNAQAAVDRARKDSVAVSIAGGEVRWVVEVVAQ